MEPQLKWRQLREDIGIWMELQFALSSQQEKEIWQFIIGLAAHLELLAVAVLWKHEAKPLPFDKYEQRLTLNQAAKKIEEAKLLTPQTVRILKDVGVLRNHVAHRDAAFGVTRQGQYKGMDVFTDLDALSQLVNDHTMATNEISAWYRAHD